MWADRFAGALYDFTQRRDGNREVFERAIGPFNADLCKIQICTRKSDGQAIAVTTLVTSATNDLDMTLVLSVGHSYFGADREAICTLGGQF